MGYYRDAETDLSLLGQRHYDPNKGRFLSRDPIGFDGGTNLYGYVGNDDERQIGEPRSLHPNVNVRYERHNLGSLGEFALLLSSLWERQGGSTT